jgi:rhamnose utilization protein RhaD (predicted bifunctional aldolase and dehydrogenase)
VYRSHAQFTTDLEQRVYTSRLLGRDTSLVLHGGGNTSVKLTEPNLFGEPVDLLYVKGSGWDLASIEAAGFAPVRMEHLYNCPRLPELTGFRRTLQPHLLRNNRRPNPHRRQQRPRNLMQF